MGRIGDGVLGRSCDGVGDQGVGDKVGGGFGRGKGNEGGEGEETERRTSKTLQVGAHELRGVGPQRASRFRF